MYGPLDRCNERVCDTNFIWRVEHFRRGGSHRRVSWKQNSHVQGLIELESFVGDLGKACVFVIYRVSDDMGASFFVQRDFSIPIGSLRSCFIDAALLLFPIEQPTKL